MGVVCIKCWHEDAIVKLHLDGTNEFECNECGEMFTCGEVREKLDAMVNGWGRVLKWVETAPVSEEATAD